MGKIGRFKSGTAVSAISAEKLRYEVVALDRLRPNPNNARVHSQEQIRELRRSYRAYGVINPPIVAPDMTILAGHGRYLAAKAEGLAEMAVLIADDLTPAEMKAYALAENKLHDMSSFDMEMVLAEIEAIRADDVLFDTTLTGFNTGELDAAAGLARAAALNDLGDDPATQPPDRPVSRTGDLFQLGQHRVICGDATSELVMERLVDGRQVSSVISDVPFNTKIKGMVSGLGKVVHEDFEMAAGEMSPAEFTHFLTRSADAAKRHLKNGALVLWFIDWRHVAEMLEAGARSGFELLNMLVWVKSNAGMGSLWRSQHEIVCAFKHGDAPHVNNVQLGVHGRHRSNVLQYPGMNAPGKGRGKALEMHATVKPVALIADLMLDVTNRGDVILDPFGGSGTAIIAAEKTDRVAYLAEISPKFVDVAVRRWEALTGENAILTSSSQTFAELAAERLGDGSQEAARG